MSVTLSKLRVGAELKAARAVGLQTNLEPSELG